MPLKRDNDAERVARVERLVDELRHRHTRQPAKASRAHPYTAERRRQNERRHGRSDAELREQRAALEQQWQEQQRRSKRKQAS